MEPTSRVNLLGRASQGVIARTVEVATLQVDVHPLQLGWRSLPGPQRCWSFARHPRVLAEDSVWKPRSRNLSWVTPSDGPAPLPAPDVLGAIAAQGCLYHPERMPCMIFFVIPSVASSSGVSTAFPATSESSRWTWRQPAPRFRASGLAGFAQRNVKVGSHHQTRMKVALPNQRRRVQRRPLLCVGASPAQLVGAASCCRLRQLEPIRMPDP
jgi:hypothetical protein